jgi:hypothetical protein
MRKIFLILSISFLAFSCRKRTDEVSQVVTASYPIITISGDQYYSIHVGDPLPTISASSQDTVLNENYPVTVDASTLDNSQPGLYVVTAKAKNKYGFVGTKSVYVAVTDISDEIDLSGTYIRTANQAEVHIDKLARGLYMTDDIGGAPTLQVPALFVQIDETNLSVPPQPTEQVGDISASDATVNMSPGDTTISWIVQNPFFGTSLRTFKKQ